MKKIILLLIVIAIGSPVSAEQKVGEYQHGDTKYDIEAWYDDHKALDVVVQVQGQYKSDHVMMLIKGEKDVRSFVASLISMKEKFVEWKKVAQENSVTDFSKEFDIEFPPVAICWTGSKWFFSFSRRCINPVFRVNEYGIYLIASGEATSMNNEYITQKWFLILDTEEELGNLIKALDVDVIKKKLDETVNTDELFK